MWMLFASPTGDAQDGANAAMMESVESLEVPAERCPAPRPIQQNRQDTRLVHKLLGVDGEISVFKDSMAPGTGGLGGIGDAPVNFSVNPAIRSYYGDRDEDGISPLFGYLPLLPHCVGEVEQQCPKLLTATCCFDYLREDVGAAGCLAALEFTQSRCQLSHG